MAQRFLATVESGIEKLEKRRDELQGKLYDMHSCDCEFCERNGDEVELDKIAQQIKETNEEIRRLKRYAADHKKEET